jgi:integrase
VVASWGDRAIASITTADVLRLVDGIADRGAGVSANRTLQQARALFGWCVKRKIIPTNPAAGIDLPHRERPRDRTLNEGELRAAWAAFKSMGHPYGDLGRLLLLLAQRQGETASMRWDQLDLARATWTIPGAVAKTGAEHVVPLPPAAVAILEAIPRVDGDLVFPARVGGKPITGFGRVLKTVHELSGTAAWHWHDLRRSARTGMARLGVLPHVAERILNHAVGSEIARIYDLHRYLPEMRRALELWSAELERIVAGEPAKVVALRR